VELSGVFGTVTGHIKYMLPAQAMQGQLMAQSDEKDGGIGLTWIWFYDEWYYTPTFLTKRHLEY
jgi:hypothetical protein